MWTLETPWYELVIRATCIFVFVFILMRLWGKKHMGELAAFDFIVLLFMSEAIQNSLIGDEKSIFGGMIVISTFFILNILMNKTTFRSRRMEKLLDGDAKVLIWKGKVNEQALQEEEITWQELHEAIRQQGVLKVSDVKQATLESNGHISVIENKA